MKKYKFITQTIRRMMLNVGDWRTLEILSASSYGEIGITIYFSIVGKNGQHSWSFSLKEMVANVIDEEVDAPDLSRADIILHLIREVRLLLREQKK